MSAAFPSRLSVPVPTERGGHGSCRAGSRAGKTNPVLITWIFLIVLAVVFSAGFLWRKSQLAGARAAPGAGRILPMGQRELAALDYAWGDQGGFIVWSSTMYGQHDLVRVEWPSGQLTRLTRSPAVDAAPRISPDGRHVAFARSREEWVSFRNREDWDVWVLDLKTDRERLVAERGADPCWTGDGKAVVFHRGGREIVRLDLETGAETVLGSAPKKVSWVGPSIDSAGERLAVTVLGGRPRTALVSLATGAETRVAEGRQLAFAPPGKWLTMWVEGGPTDNRICRVDPAGPVVENLLDMPGYWTHEASPRLSNDGALLVFGAARDGGELDAADYEIFLWRVGDAPERAARVSFHAGNDQWPDIHVDSDRPDGR